MKEICHLDIETFSEVDLKAAGLYKYAASETTELLCACYAFGDGPVHLWVPLGRAMPEKVYEILRHGLPTSAPMDRGSDLHTALHVPPKLAEWIKAGKPVAAHNAAFERRVLNGPAGQRHGVPPLKIEQMVCTAAKAAAGGLPRHLEGAAAALGGPQKNETGKNAMRALCKPRTGAVSRWTIEAAPDKYAETFLYCIDDVKAERSVDEQVPDLNGAEQSLWRLDQTMNDRGVGVDMPRIEDAITLVERLRTEIAGEVFRRTGVTPTQTAKLADWIRAHGYPHLRDLTAPVMAAAIADPKCPDAVRDVLRLRAAHAMKAPDKFYAMAAAAIKDRLCGMFVFHGAGTGRWSSTIVQLQNLFKPLIPDPEVAIEAFATRDPDWLRTLYPDLHPMTVLASCVRAAIMAAPGRDLLCMDYAQIEARLVAWLAGQIDVLKVFASGQDVYIHAAAQIFGIPPSEVTKDQRFFGKIAVLALGYQGGAGAFTSMARLYGVEVESSLADKIKVDWRAANPKVVQLWYDIERIAMNAVANPGKAFGLANGLLKFKVIDRWLYMLLPSGRRIAYFNPKLNGSVVVEGPEKGPKDGYNVYEAGTQLTYMGIDTYTRQWTRVSTYGGRLLQNACEGIARDLLAGGLLRLEAKGYNPLGSVHDEAITEPAEGHGSLDEAMQIFQEVPAWAKGLPIAAEGWRGKRYRK